MLKTRDENRSIQKKSLHMFNVWMLPDPKFNIRSTAVSIEDRDSKPQCRIHCDHLLMSSVRRGWVATFQTPADSMHNTVDSRMFPKRANSLTPDGQTSLTPWSKWNVKTAVPSGEGLDITTQHFRSTWGLSGHGGQNASHFSTVFRADTPVKRLPHVIGNNTKPGLRFSHCHLALRTHTTIGEITGRSRRTGQGAPSKSQ